MLSVLDNMMLLLMSNVNTNFNATADAPPAGPRGSTRAPRLHEVVFDLLEEALFRRGVVHRQRFAGLFQELALFAGQARGDADFDVREEVPAAPYRGKMTADQLALLEKRYLERDLLEDAGLPRLSLFYMR
jgi:hypothetical protein